MRVAGEEQAWQLLTKGRGFRTQRKKPFWREFRVKAARARATMLAYWASAGRARPRRIGKATSSDLLVQDKRSDTVLAGTRTSKRATQLLCGRMEFVLALRFERTAVGQEGNEDDDGCGLRQGF